MRCYNNESLKHYCCETGNLDERKSLMYETLSVIILIMIISNAKRSWYCTTTASEKSPPDDEAAALPYYDTIIMPI